MSGNNLRNVNFIEKGLNLAESSEVCSFLISHLPSPMVTLKPSQPHNHSTCENEQPLEVPEQV